MAIRLVHFGEGILSQTEHVCVEPRNYVLNHIFGGELDIFDERMLQWLAKYMQNTYLYV